MGDGVAVGVVAMGVGVGVVVGLAVGVVPTVGVGVTLPPQELPFNAKSVGVLLLPLKVPWKPNCNDPPAATAALYASFSAVTAVPLCVTWAFHAEVICWLPEKVQVTVQLLSAAPLFVT